MEEFSIKGTGDFIRISFTKVYGFPDETCHWGGYDLRATLELQAGCFRVQDDFYTSTGEIYEFYEQLKLCNEQLNGLVKFQNYEANFEFTLEYDILGHVNVKGSFYDQTQFGNELRFEFNTDQSYIASTLIELKSLVEKYGDMKGIKNKAPN